MEWGVYGDRGLRGDGDCGGCGDGDVYGGEYFRGDGDEGGDWHRDGDESAGGN